MKRNNSFSLLSRGLAWLGWAALEIGLSSCGAGIIFSDDDKECSPTLCMELGKDCGEVVIDGCGVLRCGDCEAPERCGAGGTPNVCGAKECKPSWECERPLNGFEKDGCENRRPNPACDAPSLCGNGVADPGEACDWNGNIGCSGSTLGCKADCSECVPGGDGCTKARCTELGKDCGEIEVDGCDTVQCGDCEAPETCGGGGTPNECGARECKPCWQCEQPLNGYESYNCGERRPNPACAVPVSSLIFDGTFEPTDKWTSTYGPFGKWKYSCIVAADRITAMPAIRRPGKTMIRMISKPEDNCRTKEGNTRTTLGVTLVTIPKGQAKEFWAGGSFYIDKDTYDPRGGGPSIGINSENFDRSSIDPEINAACLNTGISIQTFKNPPVSDLRIMQTYPKFPFETRFDIWHDWLIHFRYSRELDGFVEVYHKEEGQKTYTKAYERCNFQTLFDYLKYGYPDDQLRMRIMSYRTYGSVSTTQIIYFMNMKISTRREDVEYKE